MRATVVPANGFSGAVSFSVSGVPSGLSVSLSASQSIKGTSGSLVASVTLVVNVALF